jgi:N-ethylmaleimide reductase
MFGARAGMNFPSLFSPLKVGPYHLKHRVVMAPLTRMRAARPSHAPRPLNAEYYAQRATPGGLIIAEASPVVATGVGNPDVPAHLHFQPGPAAAPARRTPADPL